MSEVVILDYGGGNLRSVFKALETVAAGKHRVVISSDAETVQGADRIVFPGQGAIGQCMQRLRSLGLDQLIRTSIDNKPFLGICLGLQSLLEHSDEDGGVDGMGILPGKVVRFSPPDASGYKVPAMGWNQVYQNSPHPLWHGIEDGCRFYFVHSYYVRPEQPTDIAGYSDYIERYTSAIARGKLFAVQFHPEKSQQDGLKLLQNFLEWDGTT